MCYTVPMAMLTARALRLSKGLTQKEVANQLNVTQSQISKLESPGDNKLSDRKIKELADILGYTGDYKDLLQIWDQTLLSA